MKNYIIFKRNFTFYLCIDAFLGASEAFDDVIVLNLQEKNYSQQMLSRVISSCVVDEISICAFTANSDKDFQSLDFDLIFQSSPPVLPTIEHCKHIPLGNCFIR